MGELDFTSVGAALRDGWGVAALLIVASIRGWITWPSEKRAMQRTIDLWQSMTLELLKIGQTSASLAERLARGVE